MKAKGKWERTARGWRLVELRGTVNKTTKGASWKRSDGTKGKATSERAAKRIVEAAAPPPPKLTKRQQQAAAKAARAAAKRKPAAPNSRAPSLSAAALYAEAAKVPASGRFHSLVFLAPLLERFGTTPQAAKDELIRLHQDGAITLTRADLVDAMDGKPVDASEIAHGGARFHFLAPEGY